MKNTDYKKWRRREGQKTEATNLHVVSVENFTKEVAICKILLKVGDVLGQAHLLIEPPLQALHHLWLWLRVVCNWWPLQKFKLKKRYYFYGHKESLFFMILKYNYYLQHSFHLLTFLSRINFQAFFIYKNKLFFENFCFCSLCKAGNIK